ncbi:HIV Tat-specific factor 1 [Rana temporaria]|uniref:HIV Tat-specific factor 1 n=1 Tax=Rana temporaria TaxID=8407 RepID=UPI001AADB407|nr:HIV Tat-specific factor 1 [Rana temporaria]
MDSNDAFHEQLRLQELYGNREAGHDAHTFTDPSDGTEYEWDHDKKAWFPKITEDFMAIYQANYGFSEDNKEGSESSQAAPAPKEVKTKKAKQESKPQPDPTEPKGKGEKRKADPGWFNVDDGRNTNVYVSGLPLDLTYDEFIEIMSKCGIIMRDLQTEDFKVKLYKDKDGNLKGDGLCCYLKKESVALALKILDDYEIRGYRLHVESAKFQLKGEYDASKKKKKSKDYKKKLSLQQKQLDWRPEKKLDSRKRHERVIIIRNMFHPTDFEEDPLVLNEIREDLRSECEKFGQVKKVLIFDRHPDGVASVSFKEAEEGDACTLALNGRWFGGRQLLVETWDGVTDYQIEETSREREERLKGWEKFLDDDLKKSEAASNASTTLPASNGQLENKQDIVSEPTDSRAHLPGKTEAEQAGDNPASTDDSDHVPGNAEAEQAGDDTASTEDGVHVPANADAEMAGDDAASTDSSIGGSDEEDEKGHL